MKRVNGFTIIEVSLVLGIAGLIFLMAFIALPALWGGARDSERRDSVLSFIQKLKDFQTNNNRGALPILSSTDDTSLTNGNVKSIDGPSMTSSGTWSSTSWEGFYRDFLLPITFEDPTGRRYNLRIAKCRATGVDQPCNGMATQSITEAAGEHIIYVVLGAVCDGDSPKASANERRAAALVQLERGGTAFCANT